MSAFRKDYMNGRPKASNKVKAALIKDTCSFMKEWQINQIKSQLLSIRSRLNISFPG